MAEIPQPKEQTVEGFKALSMKGTDSLERIGPVCGNGRKTASGSWEATESMTGEIAASVTYPAPARSADTEER